MTEQTRAEGTGSRIKRMEEQITDPEQRVLARIAEIRKRKAHLREDTITMSHGAGGKASHTLIGAVFADAFANEYLLQLGDQAVLPMPAAGGALAMTTDTYVVSPIFFPGGDIGELAINGTVNDLAVGGATPLYISAGFILEEGLDVALLKRVVASMAAAAERAGVFIVTGDTKVVPAGKGDQIFINTSGIGVVEHPGRLGFEHVKPGDAVLVNGTIGDHGCTVMLARGDVDLEAESLKSDTAPLNGLTKALLDSGVRVHFMRDATRGGVATVLNEVSQEAAVAIAIDEKALPVHPAVRGVAEILGIDPLHVANEGKLIAVVDGADADRALEVMRSCPEGQNAARIAEVLPEPEGMVFIRTAFGGTSVVDMLIGDPLPRIC